MQLYVNNTRIEVDCNTLASLIHMWVEADSKVAVAVNQQVIPRSLWNDHLLNSDDHVDIFESIAGG